VEAGACEQRKASCHNRCSTFSEKTLASKALRFQGDTPAVFFSCAYIDVSFSNAYGVHIYDVDGQRDKGRVSHPCLHLTLTKMRTEMPLLIFAKRQVVP